MQIKNILVIGLGRIGLPQALVLANNEFIVYGIDHNIDNKKSFLNHQTPFYEPEMDEYFENAFNKTFFPFCSIEEFGPHLEKMDAIIFTIGTQIIHASDLKKEQEFDLSKYFSLLDQFFSHKHKFKKGINIIIRTTLPLGGTDRLKHYIESHHHLKESHDFYMAFVPERITEGEAFNEFKTLPVIIGAYSDLGFKYISSIFNKVAHNIIRVANPKTAEFCKLTDNSFRNTMFSYANEIAMHANSEGVNVNEVIAAVNLNYERNHIPTPGFVSGYCLSKDPYIFEFGFLKNKPDRDFNSVWFYGRKTNDYVMKFTVLKVLQHLKDLKDPCVAIVGLSFNRNIDDFRVSHALTMIEMLIDHGIKKFNIYDPNLKKNKYTKIPEKMVPYIQYESDLITEKLFEKIDAMIICDKQPVLENLNNTNKLNALLINTNDPFYLFDGWDVWPSAAHINHIQYESLGYRHHG